MRKTTKSPGEKIVKEVIATVQLIITRTSVEDVITAVFFHGISFDREQPRQAAIKTNLPTEQTYSRRTEHS